MSNQLFDTQASIEGCSVTTRPSSAIDAKVEYKLNEAG